MENGWVPDTSRVPEQVGGWLAGVLAIATVVTCVTADRPESTHTPKPSRPPRTERPPWTSSLAPTQVTPQRGGGTLGAFGQEERFPVGARSTAHTRPGTAGFGLRHAGAQAPRPAPHSAPPPSRRPPGRLVRSVNYPSPLTGTSTAATSWDLLEARSARPRPAGTPPSQPAQGPRRRLLLLLRHVRRLLPAPPARSSCAPGTQRRLRNNRPGRTPRSAREPPRCPARSRAELGQLPRSFPAPQELHRASGSVPVRRAVPVGLGVPAGGRAGLSPDTPAARTRGAGGHCMAVQTGLRR
ncbi:hypothetical protein SALBM311S_01652 [Streptomyces alboniger]